MSFFNGANMEHLKAEHVSSFYDAVEGGEQAQQVLHDVSMRIGKGEFVTFLGHNGSGEPTMAKHFSVMLLPSGGWAYVDGMDMMNENLKYRIRRHVGLVPQNPDNQLVASIVGGDVTFGPENLGIPPAKIRQWVGVTLETVEMSEYASHSAYKPSGGQKQCVAIVGITVMQPDCIVLDESTAILDPCSHTEIMEITRRLSRGRDITVVLVTHYMNEAMQADRVIVMDSDEILLENASHGVFSHMELLRQHGLDVPQAAELLYRPGKTSCTVPGGVLNEEGCVTALELLLDE